MRVSRTQKAGLVAIAALALAVSCTYAYRSTAPGITVAGAGHQWPGSAPKPVIQRLLGLDPPSTALNATDVIWRFFAAHPAG